jgi:para-nitrobenzyl esterase
MKSRFFTTLVLSLFATLTQAQCDGTGRYYQRVFSEFTVTSNILYGNNLDYTGAADELTLDIYQPVDDNLASRPLVIMCHGGSFISGSKNGPDVVPFCQDMAKMGYVVASIKYRLGFGFANLESSATQAVMRATQDLKAAIRYFRKTIEVDGNPYMISGDQFFAAGVSAGGFMTLHHAYLDEVNEIPSFLDMSGVGLDGGLEGNSGNPGYSSSVNAIINICGALGDSAWIHPGDEPACHFHGPNDQTVPYGSTTLNLFGFPVTQVDGSSSLHQRMNQSGIENCFEIYEDQDHVPHLGSPAYYDTTLSVMTQFLAKQICDYNFNCEYNPIITNLAELELLSFEIFPNPAKDFIQIKTPLQSFDFTIYNALGKACFSSKDNKKQTSISTEMLAPGVYFIEIQSKQNRATQRFIKE